MFKNITLKTLYEKRWFLLGWSLGMIAMAGVTIAFYPSIKDQVSQLLASVPKSLQAVTGTAEDYQTMAGYIGSGVFDLRMPLLTLTMAIILAIGLSAGEESSGQLDQLLAQPVSRTRIVLEKWLAFAIIILVSHWALYGAITILVPLIGETVSVSALAGVTLMSSLLATAAGSLALAVAFVTGSKAFATLVTTVLVFGSYVLTSLAGQLDWLRTVDKFSLFHYYHTSTVIRSGLEVSHVLTLLAIVLVCIVVGSLGFARRDVEA